MPLAFGYALLAYTSAERGLGKIAFDRRAARAELEAHPEVLAEAVQTVLRAEGFPRAYETLRDFTRGQKITAQLLRDFIEALPIDTNLKQRLHAVTVTGYTGAAAALAEKNYD